MNHLGQHLMLIHVQEEGRIAKNRKAAEDRSIIEMLTYRENAVFSEGLNKIYFSVRADLPEMEATH